MRAPSPTGIPELDDVLADLVDQARCALGDDLVGAYLQGSFALGDADAESDCDFLVVTRTAPTDEQCASLRAFHAELPHRPGTWNRHLEGSYAPWASWPTSPLSGSRGPTSTTATTSSSRTPTATPR